MLSPRTFAAFGVWFVAGTAFMGLFLFGTPALESRFAPVLEDQEIEFDASDREPGLMCWTWKWNKVRYAQPVGMSWSIIVDGTAAEFPTVAQRERDNEVIRIPTAASLGPGANRLCAKIPPGIDDLPGIIIRGQINYRPPHERWTIWQELPDVKVPPLK